MSSDPNVVLALIEQLVDNSAELEQYRANPRQYLADKGITEAIFQTQHPEHRPTSTEEVSTVMTLKTVTPDLFNTNNTHHKTKNLNGEIVRLSTDSDVLLVEIPKDQHDKNTPEKTYKIMSNSWVAFAEKENKLGFALFIQFEEAIPENPTYTPILKIAYNEEWGLTTNIREPFKKPEIKVSFSGHILVKKNCPLYLQLEEGHSYNHDAYELFIGFSHLEKP